MEGFTNVHAVTENTVFNRTHLKRIQAQHGTGKTMATSPLAKLLDEAGGVVFQRPGFKTVYVAGQISRKALTFQSLES